jgi:hypothetical protein
MYDMRRTFDVISKSVFPVEWRCFLQLKAHLKLQQSKMTECKPSRLLKMKGVAASRAGEMH